MSHKHDSLQAFLNPAPFPLQLLPLGTRRRQLDVHGNYRCSVEESTGRELAVIEGAPSV